MPGRALLNPAGGDLWSAPYLIVGVTHTRHTRHIRLHDRAS
jgi:hypothetical protein